MALDAIASIKGSAPAVANARGERAPATGPRSDAAPPAGAGEAAQAAPSPRDLSVQLEKLARALQESHSNLSFSVDESTGKTIVRVFRSSTGELVRQIPSEEALAIAASLAAGDPLGSLGLSRWS